MTDSQEKPDDDAPEEHTSAEDSAAEGLKQLSIEEQLQAAAADRDANYENWRRAQADLENHRKRTQKDAAETRKYATMNLVRDLLPGLDNLQRGLRAAETTGNLEELVNGMEMVFGQFEGILRSHAALPIEAVGRPFDPNLHEAVQQLPSQEHPAMTVIQELERGYILHDRVVRPSKVIVSSGTAAEADANKAESENASDA